MSSVAEPNRRGLGRGLEVLIGGISTTELAQIPVEDIYANPRQPRRRFDHESTAGLAESIRVQGVITPCARIDSANPAVDSWSNLRRGCRGLA